MPPKLIRVVAALLVASTLAAACASNKKADSTSTTTLAQSDRAQDRRELKQLIQDWHTALARAYRDPAHPVDLTRYASGTLLRGTERLIAKYKSKGLKVIPAPHPKARITVLGIEFRHDHGLAAAIHTCEINDNWTVSAATGRPVDTRVVTADGRYYANLTDGNVWKLRHAKEHLTGGNGQCATSG